MNILICDDDKVFANSLKEKILNNYSSTHHIYTTYSKNDFMEFCKKSTVIDLIIMDINLITSNGIDLALYAKNIFVDVEIIFITGYSELVEDIFLKIHPYAYVSKPIKYNLLFNHIDSICSLHQTERYFQINNKSENFQILFNEIVFIESSGRKIKIHTVNQVFETYMKLSEFMNDAPNYFVFTHKSFCVNIKYTVGGINVNSVSLITGEEIPISRKHSADVLAKYYNYKGKWSNE